MFNKLTDWWYTLNTKYRRFKTRKDRKLREEQQELLQKSWDEARRVYENNKNNKYFKQYVKPLTSLAKAELNKAIAEVVALCKSHFENTQSPEITIEQLKDILDTSLKGVAYRRHWKKIEERTEKNRQSMLDNFHRITTEDAKEHGWFPNGEINPESSAPPLPNN